MLWHNCQVEESPLIMPVFPEEALLTPDSSEPSQHG